MITICKLENWVWSTAPVTGERTPARNASKAWSGHDLSQNLSFRIAEPVALISQKLIRLQKKHSLMPRQWSSALFSSRLSSEGLVVMEISESCHGQWKEMDEHPASLLHQNTCTTNRHIPTLWYQCPAVHLLRLGSVWSNHTKKIN